LRLSESGDWFLVFEKYLLQNIPVPGKPRVNKIPFLLRVNRQPRWPMEKEKPLLEIFNQKKPGIIGIRLEKRKYIFS